MSDAGLRAALEDWEHEKPHPTTEAERLLRERLRAALVPPAPAGLDVLRTRLGDCEEALTLAEMAYETAPLNVERLAAAIPVYLLFTENGPRDRVSVAQNIAAEYAATRPAEDAGARP